MAITLHVAFISLLSADTALVFVDKFTVENYSFGTKDAQPEEDPSVYARLQRLERDFGQHGLRHTVEAVILVHENGHPHVLMLQIANSFFKL